MDILDQMAGHDHEQVIAFQNNATGLRGFLAIHDTTLGPALGGVRIWPYANDDEALADALRLSRAMTYKASLAELPCGGGKTTLVLHPGLMRAEAFEAARFCIDTLKETAPIWKREHWEGGVDWSTCDHELRPVQAGKPATGS